MAFDAFTLEDALQRGAQSLWADHGFILSSGDVAREAIFTTLANKLQVRGSFLAGSVPRRTWATAKPELDMFVVLDDVHRGYLASSPSVIFGDIASALRHTHSFTRDKDNGRIAVVENSHLPLRRQKRAMQHFRQMKSLQKFASVHADVHNLFNLERHLVDRQTYKTRRPAALAEWQELIS